MRRLRFRSKRNGRRGGFGAFGEISLAAPWERVGPLTFVRKEAIGDCGEVAASVTCAPHGSFPAGPFAPPRRVMCDAEVTYFDPHSSTRQRRTLRHTGGRTLERAAESSLLQADLAVAKLRGSTCHRASVHPMKYPGFSPKLVIDDEEAIPPPACKCDKKWTRRGYVQLRRCGRGFELGVGRTGVMLSDPLSVRLRQHGQPIWADNAFEGNERQAKRALMRTLKEICTAELEEGT